MSLDHLFNNDALAEEMPPTERILELKKLELEKGGELPADRVVNPILALSNVNAG